MRRPYSQIRQTPKGQHVTDQVETTTDQLQLTELDAVVGGLTKVGVGTLTLSNANTYTGSTQVNGGIIAI